MQIVQYFTENCPQELTTCALRIATGASYISNQVGVLFNRAIKNVTGLLKSTEDLDAGLRVIVESIAFYNVIRAIQTASTPILATLGTFRTVISTNRIIKSINYIISGNIFRDAASGKILDIISELAFLAARSIKATVWLNEQKIISDELFARISNKVGSFTSSIGISKLPRESVLDGLFAIALTPCAIKNIQNIAQGKDIPYNLMELISLCSDIALCLFSVIRESQVLEMVGASLVTSAVSFVVANPYVLATLGVVAATTGVISIFLSPSS
jgi:hypothetical protein